MVLCGTLLISNNWKYLFRSFGIYTLPRWRYSENASSSARPYYSYSFVCAPKRKSLARAKQWARTQHTPYQEKSRMCFNCYRSSAHWSRQTLFHSPVCVCLRASVEIEPIERSDNARSTKDTNWHIYHYKMVNARKQNRNSRRNILYYSLIWIFWQTDKRWQWRLRCAPKTPSLLPHLIRFHSFSFARVACVFVVVVVVGFCSDMLNTSLYLHLSALHSRWIQLKRNDNVARALTKRKRERKRKKNPEANEEQEYWKFFAFFHTTPIAKWTAKM